MLRRLVSFRRLPVQICAIRSQSKNLSKFKSVSEFTEEIEQDRSKKKVKNFYDDLVVTLPIEFINFLSEFDGNQQPSSERIAEKFDKIKPHNVRYILNQILKQNSPQILLALMPYFIDRKLISPNTMIPITQCLTKTWIRYGPNKQIEEFAKQLIAMLPDNSISNDLKILLLLCSNEWPVLVNNPNDIYMLKNDCFDALIVGALRHSDLKQLKLILKRYSSRLINSDMDVYEAYRSFVKPSNRILVDTYLEHLNGQIITSETFHLIKQIMSASKSGSIRASKVIDGKCGVCNKALPERKLTDDEFKELKSSFSEYLKAGCESKSLGSNTEFFALHKKVDKIRERTQSKSAIVLDTLNVTGGKLDTIKEFIKNIKNLKNEYDIVVLILRQNMMSDSIFMLQQQGIQTFFVNKYTDDDLFAIYMTMCLGPETLLVSNDRFSDALTNLNFHTNISHLFSIWTVNQVLGYDLPMRIQAPNTYSNLMNFSASEKSCHFMVFHDDWAATRKLFCLNT